jgi:NAD-dependent DNA ligase
MKMRRNNMTELEQKIKHYADEYYKGNELISDKEYDLLLVDLKKRKSKFTAS